jgi:hypothetical protein
LVTPVLNTYIAIIPNGERDRFDVALSRISVGSGIRANARIGVIIPLTDKTIYSLDLFDKEATLLKLSTCGTYKRYRGESSTLWYTMVNMCV